ncbi:hypothetical protein N7490_001901 [Penicillium lividum]|nr:hypothetical protein N7490_001901 [Penicillium lividum]
MHRLNLRLGLPGFTEKQKVAAAIFWREMAKLFHCGGKPIHSFPDSWNEIEKFNEKIESNMDLAPERANLIAEGCLDRFAFRFFPPGLHWLGRAIPICLSLPTTMVACQIEPVNPLLNYLITLQQEKMSKVEKKQEISAYRDIDSTFAPWFIKRHKKEAAGRPFHAMLSEKRKDFAPPKDFDIERDTVKTK